MNFCFVFQFINMLLQNAYIFLIYEVCFNIIFNLVKAFNTCFLSVRNENNMITERCFNYF